VDAANELVNQTSYDESKETDPLAWLNESK
jgi:hypothetical protein